MQKTGRYVPAIFAFFLVFFAPVISNNQDIKKLIDSSPKFADKKYVALEKLYKIDVTEIGMFNRQLSNDYKSVIDFDDDGNMYVLDVYENSIFVFDNKGKLARKFGRSGQGPKEFERANRLIIQNDRIYVFQWLHSYKVLNLEGEYISQQNINFENPLKIERVNDNFYVFSGKVDPTFTKLEFTITIVDDQFSRLKEIFKHEYPPGLGGPNYDFTWPNWLLISKNGEFYFPEDNFNEYSIGKYDKDGKPEFIFGRKYSKKSYSKEARDKFYSLYGQAIEKGERAFPHSPPIVRNMFVDSRKNIWVISGETGEDNGNPDYENAVDIFAENGEWLCSIKTNLISRYSFYDDGKIYSVSSIDPDSYEQFIDIYKIKYLYDQ